MLSQVISNYTYFTEPLAAKPKHSKLNAPS